MTKQRKKPIILLTALITFVVMAIFEVMKQLFFPDITIWVSHFITIAFVTVFITIFVSIISKQNKNLDIQKTKFRIIADFTYDWEYWSDLDNKFLYISPSCERITGYSVQDFTEDTELFKKIVFPEDRDRVMAHLTEDIRSTESSEIEFRIIHKNRKTVWISHACQAVMDSNGTLLGRRASNRDISKRKKAEQKLQQSISLYRAIARNLPDSMILVTNQDMKIVIADGNLLPVTGFKQESLEGHNFDTVLNLPKQDRLKKQFKKALEGKMNEYEMDLNGKKIWSKFVPVYDENGGISVALALLIDITELRQTRELLEKAKILDQVEDAIIGTDMNHKIRYINKAAYRQYEIDPDLSVIGKKFEDLFGYEWITDNQKVEAYSDLQKKYKWKGINIHITKSGKRLWVESSASLIRDDQGKPFGIIAVIRDTTLRKELENSYKRTADELETANKDLESFSYSVSHDLRDPLITIDGFSEILLADYADNLDKTGRDYILQIHNSVKKMKDLINDILRLSRVGRHRLDVKKTDLSSIISEYLKELHRTEPNRKVRFLIQPKTYGYGDPNLLRIALENLIRNAWKFTSQKDVTEIEFGSFIADTQTIYFIKDNGAGFDIKLSKEIFKAFKRAHTEKEFSGTGIGLSIVEKVIRRHKGNIWTESEIGKGSVFYFTLNANHLSAKPSDQQS